MKFCPDCSNFLYIKDVGETETHEKTLENYCRNCGFSENRTDYKIDTFTIENEVSYNCSMSFYLHLLTYPNTLGLSYQ